MTSLFGKFSHNVGVFVARAGHLTPKKRGDFSLGRQDEEGRQVRELFRGISPTAPATSPAANQMLPVAQNIEALKGLEPRERHNGLQDMLDEQVRQVKALHASGTAALDTAGRLHEPPPTARSTISILKGQSRIAVVSRKLQVGIDKDLQTARQMQADLQKLQQAFSDGSRDSISPFESLRLQVLQAQSRKQQADLDQARRTLLKASLALALHQRQTVRMNILGATPEHFSDEMLDHLVEIDARFGGKPGYDMGKLLAVLCNHARVREYADTPTPEARRRAIEGVGALIATVHEAIQPGRDAAALNDLIGLNNELDVALKAVRLDCLKTLAGRRLQGTAPELERHWETVKPDYEYVVDQECALSLARVQMKKALRQAGFADKFAGLGAASITPAMVTKFREALRGQSKAPWKSKERAARQFDLLIANLYVLQRTITHSPRLDRHIADLRAELAVQKEAAGRLAAAGLTGVGYEAHAQVNYLDQRLAALGRPAGPAPANGAAHQLDDDELGSLGFTPDDRKNLVKTRQKIQSMVNLARKGLPSQDSADYTLATVNKVMGQWQGRRGPDQLIEDWVQVLEAGKPEDKARRLCERLLQKLSGNPDLAWDDAVLDVDTRKLSADARAKHAARLAAFRQKMTTAGSQPRALANLPAAQVCRFADDEVSAQPFVLHQTTMKLLERRLHRMGGPAAAALSDAVRAATLMQIGDRPLYKLRPGDHADSIKATLRGWGVDVDGFALEIDAQLSHGFTLNDLGLWAREAEVQLRPQGLSPIDALMEAAGRIAMSTRYKFLVGNRGDLQAVVPLDPSFSTALSARVSASTVVGFELARQADSYEITFRNGAEIRGGAELVAGLAYLRAVGVKVDLIGGGEAWGQHLGGVSLRFPSDEKGLAPVKAILLQLAQGRPFNERDLLGTAYIAMLEQQQGGVRGGLAARAMMDVGNVAGWAGSGHADLLAGVRAGGQVSEQTTDMQFSSSLNGVHKKDTEWNYELGATVALNARSVLPVDPDRPIAGMAPVVDAGITASRTVKEKLKVIYTPDSRATAGTERLVQAYLPQRDAQELVARFGGPLYGVLIERLRKQDPAMVRALEAMIADVGLNEMFNIVSRIHPGVLDLVNEKMTLARDLREGRAGAGTQRERQAQARRHERDARALLDDMSNFAIHRMGLLPTAERTASITRLNVLFAQWTSYRDEKTEYVAMDIRPDQDLVNSILDELQGWVA